jgi:3-hydroxyisobutyrate dehydrogenase-like beta-hydroxyacid dehydrogenase
MDVGFIGLGQMGSPMAANLAKAGHQLHVWNRDPAKAAPLAGPNCHVVGSPAEAARAGIVFSMLADDHALEAVSFGEQGILSADPGVLHVSCSTVSVTLTDRLAAAHAERGQRFVSAQVLGRPDAAAAAQLSVIAAGNDDDLARCQPLFEALGPRVLRMGAEPGMAAAAKIAANVSIASIIEMLTEAYAIAGQRGVTADAMLALFTETGFGQRIVNSYGAIIAKGVFEPAGFPLRLGRKDVGLGLALAGPDTAVPFVRQVAAQMDEALAQGRGDLDWCALGQR